MSVTVPELRAYVKANEDKDEVLTRNLEAANALVLRFVGTRVDLVPDSVLNSAVLQVAQELYYRDKKTADGGGQYQGGDFTGGTVLRKDPMYHAYGLLRPFIGWY